MYTKMVNDPESFWHTLTIRISFHTFYFEFHFELIHRGMVFVSFTTLNSNLQWITHHLIQM